MYVALGPWVHRPTRRWVGSYWNDCYDAASVWLNSSWMIWSPDESISLLTSGGSRSMIALAWTPSTLKFAKRQPIEATHYSRCPIKSSRILKGHNISLRHEIVGISSRCLLVMAMLTMLLSSLSYWFRAFVIIVIKNRILETSLAVPACVHIVHISDLSDLCRALNDSSK